jgi:hypothetical protein
MTGRRVGALIVAALVVILLGLWLSSRKNANPESIAGQPVMKTLKAQLNEVSEVRVSRGDGSRVTLKKQPTGWLVGEREYPADAGKVRKLLIDLSALSTVEAKTSDPSKYSQLGVEDVTTPTAAGTRIDLVTPEKVNGVIVGKTAGMKSGYVRAADVKQSVLATPQIVAEADPKRWIDTTLVDIPESRIKEIEVSPASGPSYRVTREKKEQTDFTVTGVPKGRELSSPSAANPVAGELAMLALTDVRKAPSADAPAKPERAVFRTFDGLEIQVLGVKDGDRHFVSLVPTSSAKETGSEVQALEARARGWQFEIPAYKYDGFFKPLEELLAKPPEPAAKAKKK